MFLTELESPYPGAFRKSRLNPFEKFVHKNITLPHTFSRDEWIALALYTCGNFFLLFNCLRTNKMNVFTTYQRDFDSAASKKGNVYMRYQGCHLRDETGKCYLDNVGFLADFLGRKRNLNLETLITQASSTLISLGSKFKLHNPITVYRCVDLRYFDVEIDFLIEHMFNSTSTCPRMSFEYCLKHFENTKKLFLEIQLNSQNVAFFLADIYSESAQNEIVLVPGNKIKSIKPVTNPVHYFQRLLNSTSYSPEVCRTYHVGTILPKSEFEYITVLQIELI